MKIAIYTLGCKVNQYETQAIETELTLRGHALVPFEDPADAYIINTCTVTAVSDHKSRQAIRRCPEVQPRRRGGGLRMLRPDRPQAVAALGVDLVSGHRGADGLSGRSGASAAGRQGGDGPRHRHRGRCPAAAGALRRCPPAAWRAAPGPC